MGGTKGSTGFGEYPDIWGVQWGWGGEPQVWGKGCGFGVTQALGGGGGDTHDTKVFPGYPGVRRKPVVGGTV